MTWSVLWPGGYTFCFTVCSRGMQCYPNQHLQTKHVSPCTTTEGLIYIYSLSPVSRNSVLLNLLVQQRHPYGKHVAQFTSIPEFFARCCLTSAHPQVSENDIVTGKAAASFRETPLINDGMTCATCVVASLAKTAGRSICTTHTSVSMSSGHALP